MRGQVDWLTCCIGLRLVPPGAAWCLVVAMHEAHQAAPGAPLGGKLGGTVVLESAPSCRRLGQGAQGSWERSCLPEILKLSELFLLGMSPVKAVPIE